MQTHVTVNTPKKKIYVTQAKNSRYASQIYSRDGVLEELLVRRLSAAPDATTLRRLQLLSCFSSVHRTSSCERLPSET
jgi:hypothetical protein